jgi:mitochondrial fission 1 protein
MGETKHFQKGAKEALDRKLAMSTPSRSLLEELAVACAKTPSPDATFQYAFALSKSTLPSELRYSITILDGLINEGYEHQVDCMYGAATALYLLGDFKEARVSCARNKSCIGGLNGGLNPDHQFLPLLSQ